MSCRKKNALWTAPAVLSLVAGCSGGGGSDPASFVSLAPQCGTVALQSPRPYESDQVLLHQDRLLSFTRRRGLLVHELDGAADLQVVGSLNLDEDPAEIFPLGANHVVTVSRLRRPPDRLGQVPTTRIRVIDLSDSTSPRVMALVDLPSVFVAADLQGDLLFVCTLVTGTPGLVVDTLFFTSFDVSDPASVPQQDQETLPAAGFRPSVRFGPGIALLSQLIGDTLVTSFDLTDPDGAIGPGTQWTVAGTLTDPSEQDLHQGVLRMFTVENETGTLSTFKVISAQNITPAGSLSLSLERQQADFRLRLLGDVAVLAEGQSGAARLLDLRDPDLPQVGSSLPVGGVVQDAVRGNDSLFLTWVEPFAVATANGGAVPLPRAKVYALFDVTDPAQPTLRDQQHIAGDVREAELRWLPAPSVLVDSLLFDDGSGLFPGIARVDVDLARGRLDVRGAVRAEDSLRSVVPDGSDLLALSGPELVRIDPAPTTTTSLRLTRNVLEVVSLAAGVVQASLEHDGMELTLFEPDQQDNLVPINRLELDEGGGLLATDPFLYFVGSRLQVIEVVADQFVRRGSSALSPGRTLGHSQPDIIGCGFHPLWTPANALILGSRTLAIGGFAQASRSVDLVDVADPDAPRLAATLQIPLASGVLPLKACGSLLFYSTYRYTTRLGELARYRLHRIDVADPYHPRALPSIELPGRVLDLGPGGRQGWLLEQQMNGSGPIADLVQFEIKGGRAIIGERLTLAGASGSIQIVDNVAVITQGEGSVPDTFDLLSLADNNRFEVLSSQPALGSLAMASRDWVILDAETGHVAYRITDPRQPVVRGTRSTLSWLTGIALTPRRSYVATPWSGVGSYR